jgi:inosine-uridine nucleoside N-ribohydrolase
LKSADDFRHFIFLTKARRPAWPFLSLSLLILALAPLINAKPVPVIFDTDIGNDVDDALALAMLHALESRGEARLLAVTITKDNKWAAPFVSLVNTFYGRSSIPIGVVKGGKAPADSDMIRVPCEKRRPDGAYVYPHEIVDGAGAPGALTVLRSVLAKEQDGSVVVIQVGFSTNLARLLDTAGDSVSALSGRELVSRKVRMLSCMAGAYPTGIPEYNVATDPDAARKLFAEWPTPIVASGFEVGFSILYPASSIERDFDYVADHPMAEAYRNYRKMPYDRPTWDLTSVLYAIRPDRGYFDLSPPGKIYVGDNSVTRFEPSDHGTHRYLLVNDRQRQRVLEAMIYLASQPPCRAN